MLNTTVDEPNRIELLETASRVHWVRRHDEFAPGYPVPVLACGTDTLWDRRSFGSAAAITCYRCQVSWNKQQQQQAPAATGGDVHPGVGRSAVAQADLEDGRY